MQKKSKGRLPTTEEFLQFRPRRLDFEWFINEQDLVSLKVPKFTSNIGKTFCRLIKKDEMFIANLDKLGSAVWKHSDGNKTVKEILEILQQNFLKEKNLDQRLIVFLQQMKNLNYMDY